MSLFSFSKLRVRLMLLVLVAMIPGIAFILYTGLEQRQMAGENARQDALRMARLAAASQERFLDGAHQLLLVLSRLPEIQSGDVGRCNAFLADLLKRYPFYTNFGITDESGNIYISAVPIQKPVLCADRSWFQRTRQSLDFSVGDYQTGRITKKPSLNFAYPLLDEGGKFRGAIFAALNLNWLSQIAMEAKLPPGASVLVLDSQGMILARSVEAEKWLGRVVPDAPILKAVFSHQSEGSVEVEGLDGVMRLYAFTRLKAGENSGNASVCVGIPARIAFADANELIRRNLAWLGCAMLLALFVTWLLGDYFVLRRINVLVRATNRLSSGDWSARTGLGKLKGEVGELACAFDNMAASLETRIREHEAAEQALRHSEERSRRVFRDAPMGMVVASTSGVFWQVNQAFCEFLGYSEQELEGMNVLDITHPDDREISEKAYQAILAGKPGPSRFIKRYLSKDGRTLQGEVSLSLIADTQGHPAYFVGQILDVTERVMAEKALLKRNQQLQAQSRAAQEINRDLEMPLILRRLVESSMELTGATAGAAGLMLDGRMVFTEYNEDGQVFPIDCRFEPGTGVPGWVMQHKRPYISNDAATDPQVIPEIRPLPHFYNLIDVPVLSREEKLLGCFEIHNKTGSQPFDANDIELLKGLAASAAVALENARMTAEHLRAETELKQQHARLEEANRAKDEFIAMLSHELRTPLTPVLTCIDSFDGASDLNPEIQSAFELIRRNVQLEARLIDDLLDVARVTFGKADLHLESVDAHRPLRDALEICRSAVEAKKLSVTLDLRAANSRVMADSARLQQVVWNLINNAVKFTPESGSILIRTHNNHTNELVMEFTDNGEGIDPAMQTRIFNSFEQGRRSFGGGLGLGLTIAKGIVDAHGGRLTVHSGGSGLGSTFRIVLKTCAEETAGAFRPNDTGIALSSHQHIRILLVEDHDDTRLMIARLLAKHGYVVETANCIKDVLKKIPGLEFNLLICDVGLPDGSGLDLLQKLRNDRPDLNGIAISGYGMDADIHKSKAAGFAEHLVKPVTFSKLESAILKITTTVLVA